MEQPRKCPNCEELLPIDHGFRFDEKGNIVCEKCSKIILTTEDNSFNPKETKE